MILPESTNLDYLGVRMREARVAAGYSQAKCAVLLDLSERSYKSYELGKREPPLRIVVEFARRFQLDIRWLIDGERQPDAGKIYDLAEQVAATLYAKAAQGTLSPRKFGRLTRYVTEQCFAKGTTPDAEAAEVLSVLHDEADE